MSLRRRLATSQSPMARTMRWARRLVSGFSVPAPRVITRPILWAYLFVRNSYYFFLRVFICEPLFKAYCKSYGRGLKTDCFIHWVTGKGDIVIGDNVTLDGKISISFAARFSRLSFA